MNETRPVLDLTKYQSKREFGDIILYTTWIWNEELEDSEPCLVLVPRYRALGKPCGIALSAAYRYNDPHYCMQSCHKFAIDLGMTPGVTVTSRIMDIIMDHLDELVGMAPELMTEVVVADGVITDQDGKTRTVELLDHKR